MDIKAEVRNLVVYAGCQKDAEASRNARAAISYGRLVGDSIDAISRWADMAEAAIAYAEFQYHTDHGEMVEMGDYMSRRGQLWHRFVKAREKAMT